MANASPGMWKFITGLCSWASPSPFSVVWHEQHHFAHIPLVPGGAAGNSNKCNCRARISSSSSTTTSSPWCRTSLIFWTNVLHVLSPHQLKHNLYPQPSTCMPSSVPLPKSLNLTFLFFYERFIQLPSRVFWWGSRRQVWQLNVSSCIHTSQSASYECWLFHWFRYMAFSNQPSHPTLLYQHPMPLSLCLCMICAKSNWFYFYSIWGIVKIDQGWLECSNGLSWLRFKGQNAMMPVDFQPGKKMGSPVNFRPA